LRTPSNLGFTASQSSADSGTHPESQNLWPLVLGFNAFAEIGGGLQLIAPNVVRGVQGGTVRASAIVGPGVTGWLVSAALDF
jgi:hypothetical protein